ncbi:TMEM127 (predicted) [Pycnogonum litorale]
MYSISADSHLQRQRTKRERNFIAAVFEIIVIAILATALAQPQWFHLVGGGCNHSYLGAYQFVYVGYFESRPTSLSSSKLLTTTSSSSLIYHDVTETLDNCVTPKIVNLFRVVIALCFLAIISLIVQLISDIRGVNHKLLKLLRRNAIGSIIAVIFCVSIIGICYYMSILMEHQQKMTRVRDGAKVMVQFHVSYYLITAAGSIAIIASAANLMKRYPSAFIPRRFHHNSHRRFMPNDNALLDDYDGQETFSVPNNSTAIEHHLSPPYTRWPVQDASRDISLAPPPYSP